MYKGTLEPLYKKKEEYIFAPPKKHRKFEINLRNIVEEK